MTTCPRGPLLSGPKSGSSYTDLTVFHLAIWVDASHILCYHCAGPMSVFAENT